MLPGTHIGSGLCAGLAATLLGSPVDVIKTRVMAANKAAAPAPAAPGVPAAAPAKPVGPLGIASELLRTQGPTAFYKGFIPNFARIGSWNIVTWVTLEQLKKIYLQLKAEGKL
jgi:solute carrier family 25 uncoupling protein 8/9